MKKYIYLFLIGLSFFSQAQEAKKILLIGIDGCRADALKAARTPNLDKVIDNGYSCMDVRTVVPTWSGPGWSSILTGVWYNKHRVNGNVFIGNKLNDYTHFFNFIEEQKLDLKTVSISHWEPINDKIIRKVDYKNSPKTDEKVAEEAVKILQEENPDVLFLHFDDVDHAGHFTGFGPQNKKYIAEIEKVDSLVGVVLDALNQRKNLGQEDWLVLFSTDHGGIGMMHGGGTQVERTSFIIVQNKNIKKQRPEPKIEKITTHKIAQFSKPQHKILIPPSSKEESEDWTFEMSFSVKDWQPDAYLLNSPSLTIKTHPTDGHTWLVMLNGVNIKIQGDSINDKNWHQLQITCTKDGLVKVFQNGKIVGLEQSLVPGYNILKDSITINYAKQKKSLGWEMQNCKIQRGIKTNPLKEKWIGDESKKEEKMTIFFDWQDEKMSKNAQNQVPISTKKEEVKFLKYDDFPTIVDIVPTLLEHLKIEISQEQKTHYFDGQPVFKQLITDN